MFVNGAKHIDTKLKNLKLDIPNNMQPKSDRPPVDQTKTNTVPVLHLTPSETICNESPKTPKKNELRPLKAFNPSLLKPHHDIPATPPPQTRRESLDFTQKNGSSTLTISAQKS